jgi:uncharacterized protein YqgV (UPF0045/DUF77 family)
MIMNVAAQVSVYPLRPEHLSPAIDAALKEFHRQGLEVQQGPMSARIAGNATTVFASLRAAFSRACQQGDVVMVVICSNACPAEVAGQDATPPLRPQPGATMLSP